MEDLATKSQTKWANQKSDHQHQTEHSEVLIGLDRVQRAVLQGHQAQIAALSAHEPKVEVTNHPTEMKTPDIAKVVTAIEHLINVERKRKTDLSPLVKEIKSLVPILKAIPRQIEMPEPTESVEITNWDEIRPLLEEIALSLKTAAEIEANEPPLVIPAPIVTLNEKEVDLTPLIEAQTSVIQAIRDNKVEIPTNDDSAVIAAVATVTKTIQSLRFPIPNYPSDPLVRFKIADVDNGVTVKYAGQIANDGTWVIEKVDTSTNPTTIRYASGSSAYPTNWSNRLSLSYDYLYTQVYG